MEIGYEPTMAKLLTGCDRPSLTLFEDVPGKTCVSYSVIINGTMCHRLRWAIGTILFGALLLHPPISRSEWQLRVTAVAIVLHNRAGMHEEMTDTFALCLYSSECTVLLACRGLLF